MGWLMMSNGAPDFDPRRAVPPRMPTNPPQIGTANDNPARLLDNYAEFIERLDAAADKLTPRRDALNKALGAAELLFHQNYAGVELWGQRLSGIRQLLNRHAADQQTRTYTGLSELHDIAVRMEQMFGGRSQRMQQVCSGIRARRDPINASLFELEKSKVKLTSSRMIALERENLSKVAADLSVPGEGIIRGVTDPGLRESLREARDAIILAEALLEVKGT